MAHGQARCDRGALMKVEATHLQLDSPATVMESVQTLPGSKKATELFWECFFFFGGGTFVPVLLQHSKRQRTGRNCDTSASISCSEGKASLTRGERQREEVGSSADWTESTALAA